MDTSRPTVETWERHGPLTAGFGPATADGLGRMDTCGASANVAAAQTALLHLARCNRAVVQGKYHPAMEEAPALLMAP